MIVICPECNKECNGEKGLRIHQRYKHKVQVPAKCDICGREFKSHQSMMTHKSEKHNKEINDAIIAKRREVTKQLWNTDSYIKKQKASITKYWSNDDNRKLRSKVSKEALNRPDVKAKIYKYYEDNRDLHSQRIKKALSSPEIREYLSKCVTGRIESEEHKKKISESLKKYIDNLSDEELLDRQSKFYCKRHTYYITNKTNNKIRLDSSYELRFCNVMLIDESIKDFIRCKDVLTLQNGHKYNPDFIVSFKNGKSIIVEIKSDYTKTFDNVKDKVKTAKEYYSKKNIDYVLLSDKELLEYEDKNDLSIEVGRFKHGNEWTDDPNDKMIL